MPIPKDYAEKIIDGVAAKLREFEKAEFMLLVSDEDDMTLFRSEGPILTRISYVQLQLGLIARNMIAELQQIEDVGVFDDMSATLAMVHRIRMHTHMLYRARAEDEQNYLKGD